MTIWKDPAVRYARELNRAAVKTRRFVPQYRRAGDPAEADACEREAASYFRMAREQIAGIRDQRSALTRFRLGAFFVLLAIGLGFLVFLLFNHATESIQSLIVDHAGSQ
jgi:hypothetical protein